MIRSNAAAWACMTSSATADAVPHANVYGTIPFRNAAFRVALSVVGRDADFDRVVYLRNLSVSILETCRVVSYATIVLHSFGRKCGFAKNSIRRIDDRWTGFVNGRVPFFGTTIPRDVAFDGVISNERNQYPGVPLSDVLRNFQAVGANHNNMTYLDVAVGKTADAMRSIQMSPPPPPPPAPLSASLSGPSDFSTSGTLSWRASGTGGATPYTYAWSYQADGATTWTTMSSTGSSASRSVSTSTRSFTVRVIMTSATGATATATQHVSNWYEPPCGGGIKC